MGGSHEAPAAAARRAGPGAGAGRQRELAPVGDRVAGPARGDHGQDVGAQPDGRSGVERELDRRDARCKRADVPAEPLLRPDERTLHAGGPHRPRGGAERLWVRRGRSGDLW